MLKLVPHVVCATIDFLRRECFIFGPVHSFFIKQTESSNQNLNCPAKPICDFETAPKLTRVTGSLFTDSSGIQTLP